MVKDMLAARRYAQALFELARELNKDEEIEAELESLSASLTSDPKLEKFLTNPGMRVELKKEVLEKLYRDKDQQVYRYLRNFYLVLFEKNRFYLIHEIARDFRRIADEAQGQGIAEIRSASPLTEAHRQAIVSRIERIAGKKMVVWSEVDPSLLGGVRVKIGNKVIDDTVKNKLQIFKKELTKIQSI